MDKLNEVVKTIGEVKNGVDSLKQGLENGLFNIEDAIKILGRISDKL